MERNNMSHLRFLLLALSLVPSLSGAYGQSSMPEILLNNTLKEQMNYLEEHTKIYENYRAIREDMFQKLKNNISDTLTSCNMRMNLLNSTLVTLNQSLDSISSELESTKARLEEVTRTKNSIRLFGMEVNKMTYNSIMWLIIIGLVLLLAMGSLVFRKNLTTSHNIKKELNDLREEFQSYRKTAREAREKMSMDHFNELKKLRGG
jgi:hypothetical protein